MGRPASGRTIPDTGDPELAKKLIAESGETAADDHVRLRRTPRPTPKAAAHRRRRSAKAGIKVKPNPIEAGQYYAIVFDPAKAHELDAARVGAPDWPNASTVIPELFTPTGGFDLSQVDDKAFNAKVDARKVELDRAKQADALAGAEQGGHAAGVGRSRPSSAVSQRLAGSRPTVGTRRSTSGRLRLLAVRRHVRHAVDMTALAD